MRVFKEDANRKKCAFYSFPAVIFQYWDWPRNRDAFSLMQTIRFLAAIRLRWQAIPGGRAALATRRSDRAKRSQSVPRFTASWASLRRNFSERPLERFPTSGSP